MNLKGKTAWITGASSGIGEALALLASGEPTEAGRLLAALLPPEVLAWLPL